MSLRRCALVLVATSAPAFAGNVLELTATVDVERGWGHIGESLARLERLIDGGPGVEGQLGLRKHDHFAWGIRGGFARLAVGATVPDGTDIREYEAGLYGEVRFATTGGWRPWLGFATGWRKLVLDYEAGKDTSYHAWDLMRLQVGFERRIAPGLFVAPLLGYTGSVFVAQNSEQTRNFDVIVEPGISWFVFAGMRVRFEAGT